MGMICTQHPEPVRYAGDQCPACAAADAFYKARSGKPPVVVDMELKVDEPSLETGDAPAPVVDAPKSAEVDVPMEEKPAEPDDSPMKHWWQR